MMMAVSDTIKKLRINLHLEQEEFGDLIGVTKSAVCNYEKGVRKPRIKTIRSMIKLAKKNNMKVDIEDFLE